MRKIASEISGFIGAYILMAAMYSYIPFVFNYRYMPGPDHAVTLCITGAIWLFSPIIATMPQHHHLVRSVKHPTTIKREVQTNPSNPD